jgi:hypothetical protein
MYAQTDIHCDGEVFPWGSEVSEDDVGEHFDTLVELGALMETHPAIADNPGAVEALRAQSEQLQSVKERLAVAMAKIEELTGEPVNEFELVATTETDDDYDPGDYTVDQVIAHLSGKDQVYIDNVLAKETSGQARSTLLSHFG